MLAALLAALISTAGGGQGCGGGSPVFHVPAANSRGGGGVSDIDGLFLHNNVTHLFFVKYAAPPLPTTGTRYPPCWPVAPPSRALRFSAEAGRDPHVAGTVGAISSLGNHFQPG